MERLDRERRKEEERMMRERQREEERLKREQRREIERREKYMMKEHLRVSIKPRVIALLNQIDLKIFSVSYYTFLCYILIKAEKRKQKEEIRKEKEAERRKAALEKANARRIAKESTELIEDEQLELMELAAASKGLSSIIHIDLDTLQNLESFRGEQFLIFYLVILHNLVLLA